jgi:flavin-binding protein dodecin
VPPPGGGSLPLFREHSERREEATMSVARVTEISSTSTKSFEDAVAQGIARAAETLRGIQSAWIKEQSVDINDGKVTGYRVNMLVTFILER